MKFIFPYGPLTVLAVLFSVVHESEAATEVCEMMMRWPLQRVVSLPQQTTNVLCILAVLTMTKSSMLQLGDFGTVVYNTAGDGMPSSVPIIFKSDFPLDQVNRAIGSAWIEWTLAEDAVDVELYESRVENTDLAYLATIASQNNVATFTLRRTTIPPPVGVTKITITASLYYKNSGTVTMKMHEKIYQMTLTATGTFNTTVTSTTSTASVTAFVTGNSTGTANGTVVTPLPVGGISFTQTGPAVAFGSPMLVTASSTDPNYRLWLDTTGAVEIYNSAGVGGTLLYTWPAALVTATTAESGSSNTLLITLSSVPAAMYNYANLFVSLKIAFRDVEGGRRALRVGTAGNELSRNLVAYTPGEADVQTQVQMVPLDSDSTSGSFMVKPLVITSVTMAGLALLI